MSDSADARSLFATLRARTSAVARTRLFRAGFPLLLALLPALVSAPHVVRTIPFSHDHPTHLYKVWHFWTVLVPSGRLRGWSHDWGFGFPSDELVPCGGELWVGLFRLLSLGQLDWERTYALAFAGLMLLKSYAAFRFAACFFGAAAGVIAAWFTFLEPGAMLEGGWEWHTNWGVWPVTLGASALTLALVHLSRILAGGGTRDVACAGAWTGAALLTHQVSIPAFAIAVPLLFIDHRLRGARASAPACLRALGALGFGASLAAFFVIPFFSHTADTLDLGWLHEPLGVVVERLVTGKTFQHLPPLVHYLGLVGVVVALFGRARGGFFVAASALACVLLASDVLVRVFHLERVLPSLIKLEVNRLLLVAKIFWFPLAGYALVAGARRARELWSKSSRAQRPVAVLAVALGSWLSLPAAREFLAAAIEKPVTGKGDIDNWRDFAPFIAWSRELESRSRAPFRIAYELWRSDHSATALPVYNGIPIYKLGTTPTQIFKRLPRAPDPELYALSRVRYVVSTAPRQEPWLRFVRRFGALWVHEFLPYRPEPFRVLGKGRGELLEFSPERIRIRLSGTDASSRLKLGVASYSRWRAETEGTPLSITTVAAYGFRYPFLMEVPARDGELRFEYVRLTADWLGLWLSLAALPGFLGAVWFGRTNPGWLERVAAAAARRQRALTAAAGLLVTALALLVVVRTRTRDGMLPADSLFRGLRPGELSVAGEPCRERAPLVFQCGSARLQADVVSSPVWGVHLCLNAPRSGRVELRTWRKLGAFIAGNYDAAAQGEGHVRVTVDGEELGAFATEPPWLLQQFVQFDTRDRAGKEALVEVTLEGSAVDCFDFQLRP